jgi:hypothetical protein
MKTPFGQMIRVGLLAFSAATLTVTPSLSQQISDPDFKPEIGPPTFQNSTDLKVYIDEGHNNFHTKSGRYAPFSALLEADGFQVTTSTGNFTKNTLENIQILVIANPLASANLKSTRLPTYSAFTGEEIQTLTNWVSQGGSLLLIADHMPWGGAAAGLAESFGLLFSNGYALSKQGKGINYFTPQSGLVSNHPIALGSAYGKTIDQVLTFTGQGFRTQRGSNAKPLLILGDEMLLLMPTEAWKISGETPRLSASGMFQAATLRYGKGRLAAFGEAGLFSAQLTKRGERMGMNHPDAVQNAQFALNVMHWLAGIER